MFHASTAATAAPPRAAYPNVPRIVETVDLRLREIAGIMVRLNAEHPEGCTETTLLLEGVSPHEQREYGPAARQLANGIFLRQDGVLKPEPPSDEMLVAEASALHDELFRRLVIKLRARPDFHEDRLAAIWPQIRKRLALKVASVPLPERLEPSPSVRRD